MKRLEDEGVLCLVSLFQFCRYFTLIRRLADSQALVLAYQHQQSSADPLASLEGRPEALMKPSPGTENDELNGNPEKDSLLESTPPQTPSIPFDNNQLHDCVICLEKTEDSVLFCCSQAICTDCERRWVRKRLRCPFCRQSFSSVKEAVQTQWQLSSAIPVEQVVQDVECLGKKIHAFWEGLSIHRRSETEKKELESLLKENYVERPKILQSSLTEGGDGFVLVNG